MYVGFLGGIGGWGADRMVGVVQIITYMVIRPNSVALRLAPAPRCATRACRDASTALAAWMLSSNGTPVIPHWNR